MNSVFKIWGRRNLWTLMLIFVFLPTTCHSTRTLKQHVTFVLLSPQSHRHWCQLPTWHPDIVRVVNSPIKTTSSNFWGSTYFHFTYRLANAELSDIKRGQTLTMLLPGNSWSRAHLFRRTWRWSCCEASSPLARRAEAWSDWPTGCPWSWCCSSWQGGRGVCPPAHRYQTWQVGAVRWTQGFRD